MQPHRACLLCFGFIGLSLLCSQGLCGDFDISPSPANFAEVQARLGLTHLPLTAKSARTWIALQETKIKPLPDQTTFGEIIDAVKRAIRVKGPRVNLYMSPALLLENELSLKSPFRNPFVGDEEVLLTTYLEMILKPHVMTYEVHDDLLIITDPPDDWPQPKTVSAAEARTWLTLQKEISLKFPQEVPLRTAIREIQQASIRKEEGNKGLVIHVELTALKEVESSPDSPVTADFDNIPICTVLGLILSQVHLTFYVRDDGLLVITGPRDDGDAPHLAGMDETTVVDLYPGSLYGHWCNTINLYNEIKELKAQSIKNRAETKGEK